MDESMLEDGPNGEQRRTFDDYTYWQDSNGQYHVEGPFQDEMATQAVGSMLNDCTSYVDGTGYTAHGAGGG